MQRHKNLLRGHCASGAWCARSLPALQRTLQQRPHIRSHPFKTVCGLRRQLHWAAVRAGAKNGSAAAAGDSGQPAYEIAGPAAACQRLQHANNLRILNGVHRTFTPR